MITVHASGGRKMMEAAVEAASDFPSMKILALTVVTGRSNNSMTTATLGKLSKPDYLLLT